MTGKISKIIHVRGYGFVTDEEGLERFLHAENLLDHRVWPGLKEGDRITFEPTERPGKGFGVSKVALQ